MTIINTHTPVHPQPRITCRRLDCSIPKAVMYHFCLPLHRARPLLATARRYALPELLLVRVVKLHVYPLYWLSLRSHCSTSAAQARARSCAALAACRPGAPGAGQRRQARPSCAVLAHGE
jgi:hypothetical protein